MPAQESDPPVGAGPDNPSGRMPEDSKEGKPLEPHPLRRAATERKSIRLGGDQNSLRGEIRWTPLPTLPPRGEAGEREPRGQRPPLSASPWKGEVARSAGEVLSARCRPP